MARRMRRKQERRPGAMAIALALLASERASSAKELWRRAPKASWSHYRVFGGTMKFSG